MWALVTPEWWWIMAAWLQNKADFCVHVATEIAERQEPQDPESDPDEPWHSQSPQTKTEDYRREGIYMTHNVRRLELPDGSTKVTGWCTGCSPDNCCGCCHIETPVVSSYVPLAEGS